MKVIILFAINFVLTCYGAFCQDTKDCLFPKKLDKKWGYIDNNETLRIPYQFDSADYFSEGLALVESNGLWGYINGAGKFIIKPEYKYAESFSCGLAKVNSPDKNYPTLFIDNKGQVAFKSKIREVYSFKFDRALARVKNKIYFLEKSGKIAIKTKYPYGDEFCDGIAQLWSGTSAEYIDTLGNRIAYFFEMGHSSFNEGTASVLGNGKGFYINKQGKKIKIVKRSFYIDKSGNPVLTNTIDSLVYFPFYNGIAEVCIPGSDHKSGFIDTTGKFIVPVKYDYVSNFMGEYATVTMSGKRIIINRKGEVVADISEYDKYFPKYICK